MEKDWNKEKTNIMLRLGGLIPRRAKGQNKTKARATNILNNLHVSSLITPDESPSLQPQRASPDKIK